MAARRTTIISSLDTSQQCELNAGIREVLELFDVEGADHNVRLIPAGKRNCFNLFEIIYLFLTS